jgi:hypothetical protein
MGLWLFVAPWRLAATTLVRTITIGTGPAAVPSVGKIQNKMYSCPTELSPASRSRTDAEYHKYGPDRHDRRTRTLAT